MFRLDGSHIFQVLSLKKSAALLVSAWRVRSTSLDAFRNLLVVLACISYRGAQKLEPGGSPNFPNRSFVHLIFDVFLTLIPEVVRRYFGASERPKIDLKSTRNSNFALPFFRTCFELDFGMIFGSPAHEKQ